jgi:hypothetical protein
MEGVWRFEFGATILRAILPLRLGGQLLVQYLQLTDLDKLAFAARGHGI